FVEIVVVSGFLEGRLLFGSAAGPLGNSGKSHRRVSSQSAWRPTRELLVAFNSPGRGYQAQQEIPPTHVNAFGRPVRVSEIRSFLNEHSMLRDILCVVIRSTHSLQRWMRLKAQRRICKPLNLRRL